jgi:hypothetical protein
MTDLCARRLKPPVLAFCFSIASSW